MKILVAGADGQLGLDFCDVLREERMEISAPGLEQMDLLQPNTVHNWVLQNTPDWVVNCAAYTQVDKAEQDSETAFRINRDGARALAEAAAAAGAPMLQISTDFVFSGQGGEPYREADAAEPLSVYGRSKLGGEAAVREVCPDSILLRTAWLYGAHGQNFVKTMLRLAQEREELRVVSDQIGTPTWTRDLARVMWQLMQQRQTGIFHYSNQGQASWYEFACAIIDEAKALGFPLKVERMVPISTSDYPTPAVRPAWSVLSKEKIAPLLNKPIPQWRQSLRLMLQELKQCPDC